MAASNIQSNPPWDEDDTSPSKTPPASTSPSFPTPQNLRSWLPLSLHKTDATLAHLSRILSTPSGTDSLLLLTQYSTLAASTALSALPPLAPPPPPPPPRTHILHLLSLPTATTAILLTGSPSPFRLRLANSLRALSALVSSARTFSRLWGLLNLYAWARRLHAASANPPSRVLARIAYAQVVINVAYQVLENGAYLAGKGVLAWDERRQAKAWMWSSRFWAAHVTLEFARLAYVWRVKRGEGREGVVRGVAEEDKAWRRDLVSNLAYAPLTVHWSREEGLLGDFWVGVLGTIAGAAGFAELWKETA